MNHFVPKCLEQNQILMNIKTASDMQPNILCHLKSVDTKISSLCNSVKLGTTYYSSPKDIVHSYKKEVKMKIWYYLFSVRCRASVALQWFIWMWQEIILLGYWDKVTGVSTKSCHFKKKLICCWGCQSQLDNIFYCDFHIGLCKD